MTRHIARTLSSLFHLAHATRKLCALCVVGGQCNSQFNEKCLLPNNVADMGPERYMSLAMVSDRAVPVRPPQPTRKHGRPNPTHTSVGIAPSPFLFARPPAGCTRKKRPAAPRHKEQKKEGQYAQSQVKDVIWSALHCKRGGHPPRPMDGAASAECPVCEGAYREFYKTPNNGIMLVCLECSAKWLDAASTGWSDMADDHDLCVRFGPSGQLHGRHTIGPATRREVPQDRLWRGVLDRVGHAEDDPDCFLL